MDFRKIYGLGGPNLWTRDPAVEVWLDLAEYSSLSEAEAVDLQQCLAMYFPALASSSSQNGHVRRTTEKLAHLFELLTMELLAQAGTGPRFSLSRATTLPNVYRVVVAVQEEALGRGCLRAAREILLAARQAQPIDLPAKIKDLRELYDSVCLGPSTRAIVRAAQSRGIPARRLNERRSLVQLGQGARLRRIMTAETDRTGAVAECISQDKELTKLLLRAVGVPVPEGRPVESAADAWEAAQEVTLPVVVKPRNGNHGRGVFTNLNTQEEVEAAYPFAAVEGDGVLVERYIPGNEHRLLVVGDRVVAAARGEPASIVGDGRQTVAELVEEQINSDPRRGDDYACPLSKIDYDATTVQVIQRQGFEIDSIPPAGKQVLIQVNGNLAIDVTDEIHPEVEARAVEAARAVGLDIAGIDLVIRDIGRPMEAQRAAVVEVNAGPGLQMHLQPSVGTPRPVGEAIVATLFEPGQTGRIPVVAVTAPASGDGAARRIGQLLQAAHGCVGSALSDGVYVNRRRIDADTSSRAKAMRNVIVNPSIEAAVFELSAQHVLREGLGMEDCDVAVVTNLACGLSTADPMTDVLQESAELLARRLVESVLPSGAAVLKADEPLLAALADLCRGETILFCVDERHAGLRSHLATGGRAVYVCNGWIVLSAAGRDEPLLPVAQIAGCEAGNSTHEIEQALAAAAAGWFLNLPLATIRRRLEAFHLPGSGTSGELAVLDVARTLAAAEAADPSGAASTETSGG